MIISSRFARIAIPLSTAEPPALPSEERADRTSPRNYFPLRPSLAILASMNRTHLRVAMVVSCTFFAAAALAENANTTTPKQPVATVAGQPIYDDDLLPTVQGQLLPLRNQEYEIKKRALDNLIEQRLLENAAKESGLTTDKLLQQEVDAKVQEPTDAEVEAYYLAQKERLNRPLDEGLKTQLRQSLKQAKIQQLRQDYLKRLRSDSKVVVLLSPPKIQIGYDPKRLRGNPKAPVMIVEFSDYHLDPAHSEVPATHGSPCLSV